MKPPPKRDRPTKPIKGQKPKRGFVEGTHSPLLRLPKVQLTSWYKQRIPDYLWLCVLMQPEIRERAFSCFNALCDTLARYGDAIPIDLTHHSLAILDDETFDSVTSPFSHDDVIRESLASLSAVPGLAGRGRWESRFGRPPEQALFQIERSVGLCSNQGGREATDVAFMIFCATFAQGRLQFSYDPGDLRKEILEFPTNPSPRLASMVRAMRNADFSSLEIDGEILNGWAQAFYSWGRDKTPCKGLAPDKEDNSFEDELARLSVTMKSVRRTCFNVMVEKPRIFGFNERDEVVSVLGLYCCDIAVSAGMAGETSLASALSISRILAEGIILINYLIRCDESELERYRAYGAGRAQLLLRKAHESKGAAAAIDWKSMSVVANERFDEIFVDMPISGFLSSSLRETSIEVDCIDVYDAYYDTGSSFVHCEWSAAVVTSAQPCLNALHLGHYIPKQSGYSGEILNDLNWLMLRIEKDINTYLSGRS